MGLYQDSLVLAPDILANRPAAGAVPIGAQYCATDTTPANQLFRNNGATWDAFAPAVASGAATILSVTVNPTDADIKALPTTAFNLVAAQGANTIIVPVMVVLVTDFSAGAYTTIADGDYLYAGHNGVETSLSYLPDDAGLTPPLAMLTAFLSATPRVFTLLPFQQTNPAWGSVGTSQTQANAVNQELSLKAVTAGGNFTGGNAANTLQIITYYTVEAV